MRLPPIRQTVLVMLVIAIVIDIAYWTIWFADRDFLASAHTQAYYDFENAFPLADLWLGVACLLAFVTLRRETPAATFWLTCAGAAGLYLFGMDFLYDVENGIFTSGGGVIEALIVALTLVFSVTVLRFAWGRQLAVP